MINFILGLIIGVLIGVVFMCLLQINRDNEAQRRIDKAIKYIKNKKELNKMFGTIVLSQYSQYELLDILGGVDDE